MRVIDLLNKITNGEEAPKKIKFNNMEYKYDKEYDDYYSLDVPLTHLLDNDNDNLKYFLNDTVEIIEDKEDINIQDIEELNEFVHIGYDEGEDIKDPTSVKINELIKAVKELDRRIK